MRRRQGQLLCPPCSGPPFSATFIARRLSVPDRSGESDETAICSRRCQSSVSDRGARVCADAADDGSRCSNQHGASPRDQARHVPCDDAKPEGPGQARSDAALHGAGTGRLSEAGDRSESGRWRPGRLSSRPVWARMVPSRNSRAMPRTRYRWVGKANCPPKLSERRRKRAYIARCGREEMAGTARGAFAHPTAAASARRGNAAAARRRAGHRLPADRRSSISVRRAESGRR